MSLSDYVKYLRAMKGGVEPDLIEAATGVPHADISYIESKYRRVGEDDEALAKLADYFGVPLQEMLDRRARYRKKLTDFLVKKAASGEPVWLKLRGGEELAGTVQKSDRLIITLRPVEGAGELVVYRHAVEEWASLE